jgi:2-dehydropantoate 2-reductase
VRVAVMGAGAVGCFFGARLRQAGHEVLLIGRPTLIDAVQSRGLRLQMREHDDYIAMEASTEPSAVQGADLILFCVKSGDTEAAGIAMKPYLLPGSTVLCLQNGVDNAERLSRVLGLDAVPAAVYVALDMAGPGHVVHHGRGELIIGPSPGSQQVAQAFIDADIPTEVTPKVMDALWAKLTINCAYNALSALTQLTYGELVTRPGMEDTMRSVVDECRAVAAAGGFTLPATIGEDVRRIARSMPHQRSSTAQDVARGRRSEIDFINGYVVRRGDAAEIPVPVNRLLHSLVRIRDDALS